MFLIFGNFLSKFTSIFCVWLSRGYIVFLRQPPDVTTPAQNLHNESQIRTRNTVERCFGVWKRRFPVLSLGMRVSLRKSQAIIVATAVLHNIAIEEKNEVPIERNLDEEIGDRNIEVQQENNLNNMRRNDLIMNHFSNLLQNFNNN
ncbi:hypothetical protein RN001_003255 [Aquatica leii]|uniref:DDE Tnp4 domain-containing protein n=1 Tax=Aquatica leii TaxID=1421715 RepID=A0AAN7Q637_9COLE|nr:hypothetical protein RN001_003255 [Aquatica leii]